MKKKVYEMIVRNKFVTIDCKNVEEMIEALEAHVRFLKELQSIGLEVVDGMGDDYATFQTSDKKIADKYGFCEMDYED